MNFLRKMLGLHELSPKPRSFLCRHKWGGIVTGFDENNIAIGRCSKCNMPKYF